MPVASPPMTFCSTKSQTVPEPASWKTSGPRRAEAAEPPKQRWLYPMWQLNDSRSGSASELTPEPPHILETLDGAATTHMTDPRLSLPRSHRRSCGTGNPAGPLELRGIPSVSRITVWIETVPPGTGLASEEQ